MDEPSSGSSPGLVPSETERTWGMLAHLAALFGLVAPIVGNVAGPWLLWLLKRDESAFVGEQARESLNFNITVSLAAIPCLLAVLVLIGVVLCLVLLIAWITLTLTAAIRASEGVHYHYPFALRFVK